jgi:hypothetical protein
MRLYPKAKEGNMRKFVVSENRKGGPTIDSEVYVWKATLSNHEQADDSPWDMYILACNIHDAAIVAQEMADTLPKSDYAIVSSMRLVGAYGLYAASDVLVLPHSEYREWRKNSAKEAD